MTTKAEREAAAREAERQSVIDRLHARKTELTDLLSEKREPGQKAGLQEQIDLINAEMALLR